MTHAASISSSFHQTGVCDQFESQHWSNIVEDNKNSLKWKISPQVRATYTADGAVLLDIKKGICYSLDAIAARLWETIEASQTGITLEDIVDAVATHFEVSHDELESDTSEWLDKLQRIGLIHRDGHGMSAKAFGGGS